MLEIEKLFSWQALAMHETSERIVDCFHELVPDMALEFPFELDAFQKEVFIFANFPFICHPGIVTLLQHLRLKLQRHEIIVSWN